MHTGKLVFSQLMEHLSLHTFRHVCRQISQSLSNTQIFASRPISQSGLRPTHLSRELARHRNLSASTPGQALSFRHSWQHRTQHPSRRQRQLCCSIGSDSVCTRHYHYRSVLERVPLGALSQSQGRSQDAYAARFTRQYSHVHSYQRWQNARGQCPRHPDARSWQFLHHGSRDYRLCPLALTTPSTGILCYSKQNQSAISPYLLTSRGQSNGVTLRPNYYTCGTERFAETKRQCQFF